MGEEDTKDEYVNISKNGKEYCYRASEPDKILCRKCLSEVSEESTLCWNCNNNLVKGNSSPTASYAFEKTESYRSQTNTQEKSKGIKIIGTIISVVCIILVRTCINIAFKSPSKTSREPSYTTYDYDIKKQNWILIKNGDMIFEYPYAFIENENYSKDGTKMKFFYANKEDIIACNFIFDYLDGRKPDAETLHQSLTSSVLTEALKATDIEFFNKEVKENYIASKVKYKTGNIERNGLVIIYFKDSHYEMAGFLSYTKDLSEEFQKRITESIKIPEQNESKE